MNSAPVATQPLTWRERLGALRYASLSLLIVLLDQISKAVVVVHIGRFETVPLLPFLEFTHQRNAGAAFSFLANASGWQRWFFIGLAAVVSAGILVWLQQVNPRRQRLLAVGLSLILGGALGNLIDRLRHGFVIDFIHFHWQPWSFSFPAFNVADSAITVGAALLILDALLEGRRARREAAGRA